jgi:hypothetical protein
MKTKDKINSDSFDFQTFVDAIEQLDTETKINTLALLSDSITKDFGEDKKKAPSNSSHLDKYNNPINIGDVVVILNEGKIGKAGDNAVVYKLSNCDKVCFTTTKTRELGVRISRNLRNVTP